MSAIPNCRTDECYNQKFLCEKDKDFLAGYDCAVQEILTLFRGNLDVYPEFSELLEDNKAVILDGKAEIAEKSVAHWAEMQRNELITGILDGYSEEEYNEIREKVLNEEENGQSASEN